MDSHNSEIHRQHGAHNTQGIDQQNKKHKIEIKNDEQHRPHQNENLVKHVSAEKQTI